MARATHRNRQNILFYGGRIDARRGVADGSGRAQILVHASTPGWRIVNTAGGDPDKPLPVEVTSHFKSFAEEMSNAEFCFSPLGQFDGPTDRYTAAIMFGCIPVMLKTARTPMSMPFDERLDWSTFSVVVDLAEIENLPDTCKHHRRSTATHAGSNERNLDTTSVQ